MSTIDTPAELRAAYPYMFAKPLDKWAFEFYRGWFPLLVNTCARIHEVVRDDPHQHRFHWVQIKEKWGTLRLYWHARGIDDQTYVDILSSSGEVTTAVSSPASRSRDAEVARQVRAVVEQAMRASSTICMACAAPGELRRLDWVATLCEEHAGLIERGGHLNASFTDKEGG